MIRRSGTSVTIHSDCGFSRDTLARLRVFQIAQPVPDQPSDIKLVVQNAGAALVP
jgi:hypothetical protein